MTQGKSRMRQFRMSGSVRGVAREGDSYRDKFKVRDRHFSGSSRSNRSNRLAVSSRRFPNLPLNIELGTLNNGAAYGPASVASTRARVEKNRRKQARKILG